jgi:hypothetical protein
MRRLLLLDLPISLPRSLAKRRKEVSRMPYEKPETIVIGQAEILIQGSKSGVDDGLIGQQLDNEFED